MLCTWHMACCAACCALAAACQAFCCTTCYALSMRHSMLCPAVLLGCWAVLPLKSRPLFSRCASMLCYLQCLLLSCPAVLPAVPTVPVATGALQAIHGMHPICTTCSVPHCSVKLDMVHVCCRCAWSPTQWKLGRSLRTHTR